MKNIIKFCLVAFFLVSGPKMIMGQQIPNTKHSVKSTIPSFEQVAQRVAIATKGTMSLVRTHEDGTPHMLIGNTDVAPVVVASDSRQDVQAVSLAANQTMRSLLADALNVPVDAELTEESTDLTEQIWLTSFSISYYGIPLRERSAHINIGAINGKVIAVRSNLPTAAPNVNTASVSSEFVLDKAANNLGVSVNPASLIKGPSLVFVHIPQTGEVRLAYELVIKESESHIWRYTYDADNGLLIEKKDMIECQQEKGSIGEALTFSEPLTSADISKDIITPSGNGLPLDAITGMVYAKVHLHTPTDTLSTVGLPKVSLTVNGTSTGTDTLGNWNSSGVFPATVNVKFSSSSQTVINNSGSANSSLTLVANSGPVSLLWDDSNSDPAERDAFYAVSKVRSHVLGIDKALTGINSKIKVNVNIDDQCNANYNPYDVSLNFFRAKGGCVNTAEISDIVYHEFGHRVNHVRYQKAGANFMRDGSLNEGFADLNSALFRDDPKIGIGFFGKNTSLRTVNNTNSWPKNIDPDIHMNGLMVAGAIWDLRKLTDLATTERLFQLCGYQKPDGIGVIAPEPLLDCFTEVLMALLVTDDNDNNLANGTPHASQILRAFQMHNIGVPQFMNIRPQIIADYDVSASAYPVRVKATYTGLVGSLDKGSVKIHYSFDNGKTYSELLLADAGNDLFTGMIPKAPNAMVVKYYASAGLLDYTDVVPVNYPSATEPLSFLVGFTSRYTDDCEKDNGWTTFDNNLDIANTGGWVRGVPFGTYSVAGQFIQQDSDHSAIGKNCYITGNANTHAPFEDYVDTGKVTLTTGTLDLSGFTDPYIRYWYYFRNDEREISSLPKWTVQISNNNGSTFKSIQSSTSYTQGWFPFVVRLKDLSVTPNGTMKLRFFPNNTVTNSCVEAGVDDIEIFEAPLASGVNEAQGSKFSLGIPRPNPVFANSAVTIPFSLFNGGKCSFRIIDMMGKIVFTSVEKMYEAGSNEYSLTLPSALAEGVYAVEIISPDGIASQKISLIRGH